MHAHPTSAPLHNRPLANEARIGSSSVSAAAVVRDQALSASGAGGKGKVAIVNAEEEALEVREAAVVYDVIG